MFHGAHWWMIMLHFWYWYKFSPKSTLQIKQLNKNGGGGSSWCTCNALNILGIKTFHDSYLELLFQTRLFSFDNWLTTCNLTYTKNNKVLNLNMIKFSVFDLLWPLIIFHLHWHNRVFSTCIKIFHDSYLEISW